jgi:hypothetical protein
LRSVFKEKWKHHPLLKQCLFWAFFFLNTTDGQLCYLALHSCPCYFIPRGGTAPGWSLSLSLSHTHTE